MCILAFNKGSLGPLFSVSVHCMQIQISSLHVVVNSRSKETQGKKCVRTVLHFFKFFMNIALIILTIFADTSRLFFHGSAPCILWRWFGNNSVLNVCLKLCSYSKCLINFVLIAVCRETNCLRNFIFKAGFMLQ